MLAAPPRSRKWYLPWSWFRRYEDPRLERAFLTEEEKAAARALEAALDITPDEVENGELLPPPEKGDGVKKRGWSEDAPHSASRRATPVKGPARPPKGKDGGRGQVLQEAPEHEGRSDRPPALGDREAAPRSGTTLVTARSRLQVEEKPTSEAQDTWGLAKLSEKVTAASSRDELAREIVEYMAKHFKRAAVFAVRQQRATGWMGKGPGFFPERIDQTTLPLDEPSLFTDVKAPYIGRVEEIPANQELFAFLGGPIPPAVLIVPVIVRDRMVSVLYADNDTEPLVWVDLAVWKRVAEMMAITLEIIILKNRVRAL